MPTYDVKEERDKEKWSCSRAIEKSNDCVGSFEGVSPPPSHGQHLKASFSFSRVLLAIANETMRFWMMGEDEEWMCGRVNCKMGWKCGIKIINFFLQKSTPKKTLLLKMVSIPPLPQSTQETSLLIGSPKKFPWNPKAMWSSHVALPLSFNVMASKQRRKEFPWTLSSTIERSTPFWKTLLRVQNKYTYSLSLSHTHTHTPRPRCWPQVLGWRWVLQDSTPPDHSNGLTHPCGHPASMRTINKGDQQGENHVIHDV